MVSLLVVRLCCGEPFGKSNWRGVKVKQARAQFRFSRSKHPDFLELDALLFRLCSPAIANITPTHGCERRSASGLSWAPKLSSLNSQALIWEHQPVYNVNHRSCSRIVAKMRRRAALITVQERAEREEALDALEELQAVDL